MLSVAQAELVIVGDRLGAAWCLRGLSYVSSHEGGLDEAHAFFAQAKEQFEELGPWTQLDQHVFSNTLCAVLNMSVSLFKSGSLKNEPTRSPLT
jgi:hypothetical protein